MNLLLIGHLSIDCTRTSSGEEVEQFGGIARAIATAGALAAERDQIVPVCAVPPDALPAFREFCADYPAVSPAGLFPGERPLPRIAVRELERRGHAGEHRVQDPIPFERIRRHLGADRILVNMMSGRDITLETLDEIRIAVRDRQLPIHFDVHNLTLASSGGRLGRAPVELWRRWAFMADTIQANEEEIAALTVEKLAEAQVAGHLLTLGSRAVVVTRGARGLTVYRNDRKRVIRDDLPGVPAAVAWGCGDVFGAAFVMRLGRGDDPLEAARAALAVSAERCVQAARN